MKVLVTAASKHGSTAEIAKEISTTLAGRGLTVTVCAPDEVGDVTAYDAVVLGSAVYAGHWLPEAKAFVRRAGLALAARPVWLFSSGPVGDPRRKLVQRMGMDPVDLPDIKSRTRAREHRMFGGRLRRADLGAAQRLALLAFPWMTGDFRDWSAVTAWADGIAQELLAGARS